jgi:hypothetical protein
MITDYMDCPLRAIINEHDKYFKNPYGGNNIINLLFQLVCGVSYLHKNLIVHGVSSYWVVQKVLRQTLTNPPKTPQIGGEGSTDHEFWKSSDQIF